jgi:outer membrane protein TolC
MEQNPAVEHETTLEHALDVARRNAKEAKRLLDDAVAKRDAGEVDDARVNQLRALLVIANEDLVRVTREQ